MNPLDHIAGLDRTADGFKVRKVDPAKPLPPDLLEWLKKHKPFICAVLDLQADTARDIPNPETADAIAYQAGPVLVPEVKRYQLALQHVFASLDHDQRREYQRLLHVGTDRGFPFQLCDLFASVPFNHVPVKVGMKEFSDLTNQKIADWWNAIRERTNWEANEMIFGALRSRFDLRRNRKLIADVALMDHPKNPAWHGLCFASRYATGDLSGILWVSIAPIDNLPPDACQCPVWGYAHALMGEHLLSDYLYTQQTGIPVGLEKPEVYLTSGIERLLQFHEAGRRAVGGLFETGLFDPERQLKNHRLIGRWASRIQYECGGDPIYILAHDQATTEGKDLDREWATAIQSISKPKGTQCQTTIPETELVIQ